MPGSYGARATLSAHLEARGAVECPIHHFTLIVDGPDVQEEALVDALFEAGCDDGLVGRSEGIQYIEFDREGPDREVARLSAVADVEKVPGVRVARIAEPCSGLAGL